MADHIPAITLTDDRDSAESPGDGRGPSDRSPKLASARPRTPVFQYNSGRRGSSSTRASPGRSPRPRLKKPQSPGKDECNDSTERPVAIDPLSQHIFERTNTPFPVSSPTARERSSESRKVVRDDRLSSDQSAAQSTQETSSKKETAGNAQKDLRKGVKAVSFLTRFIGSRKTESEVDPVETQSISSEGRLEGNRAELFAQSEENVGFNLLNLQPPAYIKVRAKHKKQLDLDHIFLAQELRWGLQPRLQRQDSGTKLRRKAPTPSDDSNTVWSMEFSRDGKYLAAGGADRIVRVWAVLSNATERQKHETQESSHCQPNVRAEHLRAPVFQSDPIREYEGHKSTVLDLSWSKTNFLLSSSMDKTVRLWHVSRAECLCTFNHSDFVPSISFHPKDDRFFLAGSLDSRLRLWSIPDKTVAFTAQVPDLITAVAFTPDGKFAIAGCLGGLCMFYETEHLKYQTQINVRSTKGANAKGSKITGICSQFGRAGNIKVLITSNDSRMRIYNFRDKSLELKFRGNANSCSQIRATFSDDGRYVVCGSEDRNAYIWSVDEQRAATADDDKDRRDKTPMEMFEAHDTITTVVCIAPTRARVHLSRSGDPIYDLCNPPPSPLRSENEWAAGSRTSSPGPMDNSTSVEKPAIEADPPESGSRDSSYYPERSAHRNGNILVTADLAGGIKVFRQDCAWSKRRHDDADRASLFSRRANNDHRSRTTSLATRGSQRSLIADAPPGRNSTSLPTHAAGADHILSWRQSVLGGDASKATSRSISPSKPVEMRAKPEPSPAAAVAESARGVTSAPAPPKPGGGALASPSDGQARAVQTVKDDHPPRPAPDSPSQPEGENPLAIETGRSYLFWNLDEWAEHKARMRKIQAAAHPADSTNNGAHRHDGRGDSATPPQPYEDASGHLAVRPTLHSRTSFVSQLSDEHSGSSRGSNPDAEFDDAREHGDEEKCPRCGGTAFSVRKDKEGDRGKTWLVCTKCGAQV